MVEEASFEFIFRKIDKTRNYLLDEIKYNDLIRKKYKKTCKHLNYVENLLILASAVTGCISISAFASLVCVPVGIASSAVGINICAITARIKNYKSIIKNKEKKRNKIVLLGIDKLNTIEFLISKALIDSNISQEEFASVNNVLREYNEVKEEIKNPKTSVETPYKNGWYKEKNVLRECYRDNNRQWWNIMFKWKTYRKKIKA